MSSLPQARVVYEFGAFRVDPAESRLSRDGVRVALSPKAFETLVTLVSRAGRLVDKAELLREVWPDTVVEESSLAQHVYLVRKALGEDRGEMRCIETVPKRGYRFVATVNVRVPGDDAPAPPQPSTTPIVRAAVDPPPPVTPPAVAERRDRALDRRPRIAGAFGVAAVAALVLVAAVGDRGSAPATGGSDDSRSAATSPSDARRAPRSISADGRSSMLVPRQPQAYDSYVRGLGFWSRRTADGVKNAIKCFEAAVQLEGDFAPALAALADAHAVAAALGYGPAEPREGYEKARAAALRAIQLDANLSTAHTALALVLAQGDHDLMRAEREYQIALRLDPSSATALQRYAQLLVRDRRLPEAIKVAERALALEPGAPALNSNLCYYLYLQRDYQRAVGYCDKAIELQPDLAQPLTNRALVEAQGGRYGPALALLERARRHAEGTALLEVIDVQGYTYARSGRRDDARVALAELERLTSEDDPKLLTRLSIHAALGETDRAFALLRSARASTEPPFEVEFDPRYDSLRSDPRYSAAMAPTAPASSRSPVEASGGSGERQTYTTVD